MRVAEQIHKLISVFEDRRLFPAILTWPKFSLESFLVVSRLVRQNIKPRTVLDLGANVGQFAVAAAKLFSDVRVHSFEPDPDVMNTLKRNVSKLNNVMVYQTALGDFTGEIDFNVNRFSQVSSILPLGRPRLEAFPDLIVSKTIKVRIHTLDDFLLNMELKSPVLLKIDVQGYEDKVLMGAKEILKSVDYIVIEVSFKQLYEGEFTFLEIVKIMSPEGFIFLRPLSWHISPINGEIIEMDALFVRSA